jgi:hypothetical protein
MRQRLFFVITLGVVIVLTLLTALGLDAILHLKHPATSLAHQGLAALQPRTAPDGPDWPELTDESQIKPYFAAFKANGIGLGNSPYKELITPEASINHVVDGCERMKPNLRKTISFFRSELFNSFDPLNYFYDAGRKLPEDVQQFLDRYSFRRLQLTSNENGERITLPAVQSPDKIIVAGDSMGMSAMVDDDETLASQLQAADPAHQYVNIGISGASAEDVACALNLAAKRYAGQIRGVIYPFSENDLHPKKPYGTPEKLIAWLAKFKADNAIANVTIIYMPYIYNSVPELTRIPGHVQFDWRRHGAEKARFLALGAKAGFRALDYTQIAEAEKHAAGSEYAALALYVDHCHLSRLGIKRLVDRLLSKDQ